MVFVRAAFSLIEDAFKQSLIENQHRGISVILNGKYRSMAIMVTLLMDNLVLIYENLENTSP